ncbi:MAG TPA: hypothetical protein VFG86_19145 [Chloroflexota bacterium]|jgi:hypothetical protein|nr:hypothetical protein [Chloroflexota bacterium]
MLASTCPFSQLRSRSSKNSGTAVVDLTDARPDETTTEAVTEPFEEATVLGQAAVLMRADGDLGESSGWDMRYLSWSRLYGEVGFSGCVVGVG